MRLFSIGGTGVFIHPLLLPVCAFLLLSGQGRALFLSLFALSLHEGAHALMAKGLGCGIKRIELQPFGFVARLGPMADRYDEFCVAAAGPLFSLLSGICCIWIGEKTGGSLVREFGHGHLSLGLLNLLPALPLDGGRMLSSGLFLRGIKESFVLRFSIWIACILLLLGFFLLFEGNPTLLFLSVFLLIAAYREGKNRGEKKLGSYFHRRERLKKRGELSARVLAVPVELTLGEALRLLEGERYTLLLAVDGDMQTIACFDEGTILFRASREGMGARLLEKESGEQEKAKSGLQIFRKEYLTKEEESFSSLR